MVLSIFLLLWLIMAQSCMKMRISDQEAKKKFDEAGISLKTPTININGFPLHYAQTGNDTFPTLLFVHGTPGSWDAFQNYLKNKELLQHYRIISIDRPGFGYSDFGNAMNLSEQTKIISQWMDSIYNGKPMIVIGHSLGGPMAIKLGGARPQYMKTLVLLAGSQDPNEEKPEKWRPVLFKTPLNYLIPGALRPSNEELWYLKKDLKEMDGDYEKITFPVYILHGKKDMLVPYGNMAYTEKMLTKTDAVYTITFEKENHFIVWTREKEIVELLMKLK
ncbi:MAG: alpha/beta hydrolase [Chitinophagaceae bacterium]|nr:alpha/beta hydrolase [Chitinophagaceae bacterium]